MLFQDMVEIKKNVNEYSPLVLAYIGDVVYELLIRQKVIQNGNRHVHQLHEESASYANATTQSLMMRKIQEVLTPEESSIFRRGRNVKSVSAAKNATITDYRRATGFEAVIGYLYLTDQMDRIEEIVKIGFASLED